MSTLKDALESWLEGRGRAVVTDYDLAQAVVQFYRTKTYRDEPISLRKDVPDQRDFRRAVRSLQEAKALAPDRDLLQAAHRVMSVSDEPAEAVLCAVDPFLYVSHLSAMQRHGLTNRNPVELSLSRPAADLWKRLAAEKASAEFDELVAELTAVPLPRFILPRVVRRRSLQIHDLKYPGKWQQIRESPVRVATIGQTFIDMLTRPQWCGGMPHVLDVWERNANTVDIFLDDIIEAVEAAQANLVKVRAGYILDERLEVKDSRIEAWTAFAQRGGSRRLDPAGKYKPVYSEKWMISINAEAEQSN